MRLAFKINLLHSLLVIFLAFALQHLHSRPPHQLPLLPPSLPTTPSSYPSVHRHTASPTDTTPQCQLPVPRNRRRWSVRLCKSHRPTRRLPRSFWQRANGTHPLLLTRKSPTSHASTEEVDADSISLSTASSTTPQTPPQIPPVRPSTSSSTTTAQTPPNLPTSWTSKVPATSCKTSTSPSTTAPPSTSSSSQNRPN